jgi:hypothetical protein
VRLSTRGFWTVIVLGLLVLSILKGVEVFSARHGEGTGQIIEGRAKEKEGQKILARVDTIYKRDTVRLTREVTKYRAFRDTLKITDTVQVKEFVRQADSTIHACLLTVQTCEQKDSAHKVIEAGLRQQNDGLKKLVPSRTEKVITAIKWGAIGFAVGTLRK